MTTNLNNDLSDYNRFIRLYIKGTKYVNMYYWVDKTRTCGGIKPFYLQ